MKSKDLETLERFQRKSLKQFQGLPDITSSSACFAVLGVLPVESILHMNLLNMFVRTIRNKNSIEFKIAKKKKKKKKKTHTSTHTHAHTHTHTKVVMRDSSQDSIFIYIKGILAHCGLPSIFSLLENTPSKPECNRILIHKIHDMIETSRKVDTESKSATKYINPNVLKVGVVIS